MEYTHRVVVLLLMVVATVCAADGKQTTGEGCIEHCKKKKDGFHQACDSCDTYIECKDTFMKTKNCQGKKVWDNKKQSCVPRGTSSTCTPILIKEETKDTTPGPTRPPNIVYILTDDQGSNDMGYVNPEFHTPNLDTLATNNGRIFDQLYFHPVCTPSRTAIMTGQYAHRAGMQHFVLTGFTPHCVPFDLEFLPEKMKKCGYSTHLMGKWHLGSCQRACTPPERGFDTTMGMYGGQGNQFTHESQPPDPIWYDWRNNHQLDFSANGTHITDMVNDHAINLLRTLDKDKPFFMILTHTVPHHPLQVPEQYLELFPDEKDEGRKKVKAMLAHLDHRTGDLVEALQEEGFYDNTIIMYTADNGGDTESHHDNSPQRGGKGSNFEGGARVLGFVHSPLLKNTDTVPHHDGLLHATDLHSTFVSLAGCHPGEDLDGIDQREMIMNGYGSKRSDVVYNIDLEEPAYFGHAAYRDTEYKIMWGFEGYADGYGLDATLAENYPPNLIDLGLDPDDFDQSSEAQSQRLLDLIELRKMVPHDINSGSVRLFNLKKDPEERTNLAEDPSQAWRVMAMKKKILSLIEEGYQIPPPESKQFWAAEAFAAREQGAWGTGWCDNLEFNRNVKP